MDPEELAGLVEVGDRAAVEAALQRDPTLVSRPDPNGNLPLHLAAWQKHAALVGALLAYGADVRARGAYGRTPLHYAVHEGDASSAAIVGALLERGADPGARDDQGYTPEGWAKVEMVDGLGPVLALLRGAAIHVAFLRGMNLGKRRLDNATLCAAVASLGFVEVGAFRASGNVWFRDPAGEPNTVGARLSAGLLARLGYPVPAVIRPLDRVRSLATARPWSAAQLAATAGNVQVVLVERAPADRTSVLRFATETDALAWASGDLLWLPRGGISDSALDLAALERELGLITVRTARTLAGLVDRVQTGPAGPGGEA